MCAADPRQPPLTPCKHLSPQWPYCEKRCSYCNFNKYIPRGVDEATVRSCLVTEAQTLLRLSGVQRWVLGGWRRGLEGGVGRVLEGSPRSHLLYLLTQGGVCVLWWRHPESGQSPHGGCCPGGSGPDRSPARRL